MRNFPVYNVISFTATVPYELLFLFYNIFNDLNHKKTQNFSPASSDKSLRKNIFRSFVDFYRVLIQHMATSSI